MNLFSDLTTEQREILHKSVLGMRRDTTFYTAEMEITPGTHIKQIFSKSLWNHIEKWMAQQVCVANGCSPHHGILGSGLACHQKTTYFANGDIEIHTKHGVYPIHVHKSVRC